MSLHEVGGDRSASRVTHKRHSVCVKAALQLSNRLGDRIEYAGSVIVSRGDAPLSVGAIPGRVPVARPKNGGCDNVVERLGGARGEPVLVARFGKGSIAVEHDDQPRAW